MNKGIVYKGIFGLIWNYLTKLITFASAFLLVIVISRNFSSDKFGLYTLVMTIINFLLLLSFGFEDILNKYIPRLAAEASEDKMRYLMKKIIHLRGIVAIFMSIVLFLFSANISQFVGHPEIDYYLKICSIYFLFSNFTKIYRFILTGLVDIKPISVIDSLEGLFNLVLIYLFISYGYQLSAIFLILAFTSLISCLLYKVHCNKYLQGSSKKFELKSEYKYGLSMWIITVAAFALGNQTDIFLLNYFVRDLSEIAYYNISYTLSRNIGNIVTMGLSGVLLSIYSEVYSRYGNEKISEMWSLNIKFLVITITPIIFYAVYYAHPIITFFFPKEYEAAVYLFQLYSSLFYVSWILGGGANMTVMMIINKENTILYTRIFSGILNLVFDIILIPLYGAVGAIIATGGSTIFVILLERIILRRYLNTKYPLMFLSKIIIASLVPLVLFYYVQASFFLGSILYPIIFIVLLFILKPIEKQEQEYMKIVDSRLYAILKYISTV